MSKLNKYSIPDSIKFKYISQKISPIPSSVLFGPDFSAKFVDSLTIGAKPGKYLPSGSTATNALLSVK